MCSGPSDLALSAQECLMQGDTDGAFALLIEARTKAGWPSCSPEMAKILEGLRQDILFIPLAAPGERITKVAR